MHTIEYVINDLMTSSCAVRYPPLQTKTVADVRLGLARKMLQRADLSVSANKSVSENPTAIP